MLSVNFPFCGSRTCSGLAVSTLYNEILPSCEPDITYLSHGENATVHKSTGPSAAWFNSWPVSVFQMQRPESSELLAIVFPSELTATETTPNEWPDNCWRNSKRLSFRSQTFTTSSKLPVTMKSFTSSADESLDSSGSADTSSALGFFGSPVRPHATLQILSSWASSCLCNREYWKWILDCNFLFSRTNLFKIFIQTFHLNEQLFLIAWSEVMIQIWRFD